MCKPPLPILYHNCEPGLIVRQESSGVIKLDGLEPEGAATTVGAVTAVAWRTTGRAVRVGVGDGLDVGVTVGVVLGMGVLVGFNARAVGRCRKLGNVGKAG